MGIIVGVPNMRDVEYFETSAVLITAVLLGKYCFGIVIMMMRDRCQLLTFGKFFVTKIYSHRIANVTRQVPGGLREGADCGGDSQAVQAEGQQRPPGEERHERQQRSGQW